MPRKKKENVPVTGDSRKFVPFSGHDVPPELEDRVQKVAESVDFSDSAASLDFGQQPMSSLSEFTGSILAATRVKDSGPMGESLNELIGVMQESKLSLAKQARGFLNGLPVVGKYFMSAEKKLRKMESVLSQVDAIADRLNEAMEGLKEDIRLMDGMYEKNYEFFNELGIYIAAGERRLEEARKNELPELEKQAAGGDPIAAQRLQDFAATLSRFERRIHDLKLSQAVALQTAPQIRMLQSNDQILAEKIGTSILATIPTWKNQMVLSIAIRRQNDAVALQKGVTDTTNQFLRENAKFLHQATVGTARESERSVIDIESLKTAHDELLSSIEEAMNISREGRAKRLAAEKELKSMEASLHDRLKNLAVKSREQHVALAAGR